MSIKKTLLTCSPREFLVQTNRIKKTVEQWLTITEIKDIINRKPNGIQPLTGDDEKDKIIKESNSKKASDQGILNLSDIMDSALEKHTDETLEIIALMFFMSVDELNKIQSREMLVNLNALLNDEAVVGFFSSLQSTAQTFTGK